MKYLENLSNLYEKELQNMLKLCVILQTLGIQLLIHHNNNMSNHKKLNNIKVTTYQLIKNNKNIKMKI